MKLPAFQFYPGDWRKDPGIQALSFEERGIWVEILCLMHESSPRGKLLLSGKPYPIDRLARALCLSPEVMGKVISDLITLGVAGVCPETGALICKRMIRDDEIIKKRAASGKLGGNPAFKKGESNPYYPASDKQNDNQDGKQSDKQKITPSSSSSSSDNIIPPTPFKPEPAAPEVLPFDSVAFRDAWSDFKQHRKEIKKKLTPMATKHTLEGLRKIGEARSVAAIRYTISKGWQGIREPDELPRIDELPRLGVNVQ